MQVRIAQGYERGGAACLSVLTDSKYFQGGFENLRLIRDAGVQVRCSLIPCSPRVPSPGLPLAKPWRVEL